MDLRQSSLLRQKAFIDGLWVDADGGATFSVRNPATGEELGSAPTWVRRRRVAPLKLRKERCRVGGARPPRSGRRSCVSGIS